MSSSSDEAASDYLRRTGGQEHHIDFVLLAETHVRETGHDVDVRTVGYGHTARCRGCDFSMAIDMFEPKEGQE